MNVSYEIKVMEATTGGKRGAIKERRIMHSTLTTKRKN
jgi:hypothetical protein